MTNTSQGRMQALLEQIRQNPGVAERMPEREGAMVRAALAGDDVYQIAQAEQVSERAVWDVLAAAARQASGQPAAQVEVGGLGSDTDPGVTGGYGDTGFGALGNETPGVVPDEPTEG